MDDFYVTGEGGHSTVVASIAGGLKYGQGTPNVILVVANNASDAWLWAARQPWIDLISVSWAEIVPVIDESVEASREAVAAGKVNCVAAGNTAHSMIYFEAQGPAANLHVGAADSGSLRRPAYSGWPVDVLGLSPLPSADYYSVEGENNLSGTSIAAPYVCAQLARAISDARARVGDFVEGPHGGGLVVGPSGSGFFTDGVLDRDELEDAVESTAVPIDEELFAGSPGPFTQGYGLVSPETIAEALEVIFGERPRPERPEEDQWQALTDSGRDAVWDRVPDCPFDPCP
ncbi:MAG: S8/S53 family peptidase [Actinomycetota bacterium]